MSSEIPAGYETKHGLCYGSRVEGVLEIKLHSPKKRNTLKKATYLLLNQLIVFAQTEDSVKVIFIHGGKFFTAGNDLMTEAANPQIFEKEWFYEN